MVMHPFRRPQLQTLCERLESDPAHIVAIFGPRQTGKTTLVQQALAQVGIAGRYLACDGAEPSELESEPGLDGLASRHTRIRGSEWLAKQWSAARREANRRPRGFIVVFDEVQQVPNWSAVVKGLWDADRARSRPLRVVILGSAPLLMQAGLDDSLAGRFLEYRVTHWSYAEMAQAFGFGLEEYCFFGGYPGAAPMRRHFDTWSQVIQGSIIAPAIRRDVLAMTRIDKPPLMRRFLEVASVNSGKIMSLTKIMGHLQDAGNTTTLARYLDLLSQVGLLTGLSKYHRTIHRRRASIPKLNVLNTALMTAESRYTFEEARSDRSYWGRIVESAVGAHLVNTATATMRVHYWRHRSDEVDFVLTKGPRVVAIEVKSGVGAVGARRRGMDEFNRRFHPFRSVVTGADGIPLDQFLSEPASRWFESS